MTRVKKRIKKEVGEGKAIGEEYTVCGEPMKGDKHYNYIALASDVLLVKQETEGIDWCAYIGAVPGKCHEREWQRVAEEGNKVDEKLARLYFNTDLPWRA